MESILPVFLFAERVSSDDREGTSYRRTLASALIILLREKDRSLVDPFCGSQYFSNRGSLMAADIAPEHEPFFPCRGLEAELCRKMLVWEAVEEAQDRVNLKIETDIQGYDIDAEAQRQPGPSAKMAG